MKHGLDHWRGKFVLLEVLAEKFEGGLEDGFARSTVEHVVVIFMKALASGAAMVDLDSFFFGSLTHDFVPSPKLEGKFCGGTTTTGFLTVASCFDGFPVDEIKGG